MKNKFFTICFSLIIMSQTNGMIRCVKNNFCIGLPVIRYANFTVAHIAAVNGDARNLEPAKLNYASLPIVISFEIALISACTIILLSSIVFIAKILRMDFEFKRDIEYEEEMR